MTKTSLKMLALIVGLNAFLLMVGPTGCAGDRYHQSTSHRMDERNYDQDTDQRIEDSRTAERAREALAAAADYRYDEVRVTACNGVVRLSGVVNTSAQKSRAGEVTSKAVGVKSIENNLTIKD